jgi:hypothetical protein
MDLNEYKSKRKNVDSLIDKLKQTNDSKKSSGGDANSYKDDRLWSYTKGSDGNALAVIRFLPAPTDTAPIVSNYSYFFQGPGGWYIERDPSTIDEKSPVMIYNSKIINGRKFDTLDEVTKMDIRSRSRKKDFYANILVVKDSAKPENEGKVFLWKFPQTIYDMVISAANPEDTTVEEPVEVFDLFEGCNFKLKVKKNSGGKADYSSSSFMEKSPLSDEMASKVLAQLYPLDEFISPKNIKSFDELQAKFNRVMGFEDAAPSRDSSKRDEPKSRPAASAEDKVKSKPSPKVEEPEQSDEDVEDPDEFFRDL